MIVEPALQETVILQSSTPIFDSPAPLIISTEVPEASEPPTSRPARPAPGAEPSEDDDELREQNRLYKECHDDVSKVGLVRIQFSLILVSEHAKADRVER